MEYSSGYHSSSISESVVVIIICILIIVLMVIGVNACSSSNWNDGYCPNDGTRYELRGASKGLKYYACPECGNEVERY